MNAAPLQADAEAPPPLVRVSGLSVNFGATRALAQVDVTIGAGEIVALAGEPGAGKTTLIRCIAGDITPAGGQIVLGGRTVPPDPASARRRGVGVVYQDLALCDNLDIVQNMFLGHEPLRHRLLDEPKMELAAGATLESLSVTTVRSIRQPVASLSGGQRQSVAVAKAVMSEAQLVIMDEPTAALGVSQTTMVLELIKRLSDRGVAVLVISHNLNDVFEVADRIAVLYLGRLAVSGPASEFDRQSVVEYMTTGTAGSAPQGRGATQTVS